jgi:hypothetical protein
MSKKIRNIIFLITGGILGIIFLQTVYSFIYYGISEQQNPHPSTLYLQIYAFMDPNNLSIFLSILFFVGIMLVIFFNSYE